MAKMQILLNLIKKLEKTKTRKKEVNPKILKNQDA